MYGQRTEEKIRIASKKMGGIKIILLDEFYGIRLPDEALLGYFRSWANQRLSKERVIEQNQFFNRYALELFFLFNKLIPIKWAAARLGMTKESFKSLLKMLEEKVLIISRARNFTDQLIEEVTIRNMPNLFPELSGTVFEDNNSYCEEFHKMGFD